MSYDGRGYVRPPYFVTPRAYFENMGYQFADDAAFIAWFSGNVDAAREYAEAAEESAAEAGRKAEAAETALNTAVARALDAEAWAVGTRGGEAVPEEDPAHENNAAYYVAEMQETQQQVAERQTEIENELDAQNTEIAAIRTQVSSTFDFAQTPSDMTNTSRAYVLVGPTVTVDGETYMQGAWYYHDDDQNAWVKGGVYVDTDLELPGVPADAKAVGDRLSLLDDAALGLSIFNGGEMSWAQGNVKEDGTRQTGFAYAITSDYIPVSEGKDVVYTGQNEGGGSDYYCYAVEYDQWRSFIRRTGCTFTLAALDRECRYIRFVLGHWAETKVKVYPEDGADFGAEVRFELAKTTKKDLDELTDLISGDDWQRELVVPPAVDGVSLAIAQNRLLPSEKQCVYELVEIPAGTERIRYTQIVSENEKPSDNNLRGALFFDENKDPLVGIPYKYGADAWGVEWAETDVPDGAAYVSFTYFSTEHLLDPDYPWHKDWLPFAAYAVRRGNYKASVEGRLSALEEGMGGGIIPLSLHTRPKNDGVLNVIKRARQMTDFNWRTAVDLQRFNLEPGSAGQNYAGAFLAGNEYQGLPYGRTDNRYVPVGGTASLRALYGYEDLSLGIHVPFEAFYTAAMEARSIVCTARAKNAEAQHCSTAYAIVCSGLVSYALGLDYHASSVELASMAKMADLGDAESFDLDELELGDILDDPAIHVAIITDLVRDADGHVVAVEISEATTLGNGNRDIPGGKYGGLCRRKGWTVAEYLAKWGNPAYHYHVYRYADIATVPYTPNQYIKVGDELDSYPLQERPCLPYEGEGFRFKRGYIPGGAVRVLVSCGSYPKLRVFRDNAEVEGSPYTIEFDEDGKGEVAVEATEAGDYRAYLTDGADGAPMAAECHWSIA